jgi:uncharacterized membrane protein
MLLALLALVFAPALALAGPRSGASFGGRPGFRSGGGSVPSYSGGRDYSFGGGNHYYVSPGWGWGWGGGYGYGGGLGLFGTIAVMAVAGLVIAAVVRAVRRSRDGGGYASSWSGDDDYETSALPNRAFLYRLQLALGRSARGVQERLAEFAAQGDTSSEAGLGALLQQTALEILRQKDAVRYANASAQGPMSLTNAETAMNALTMAERSRFEVERVRASDGRVNRSTAAAEEGKEALELVVVTVVVATRNPLPSFKSLTTPAELAAILSALGSVVPQGLLGLEVVWTPADPNDSMTETDLMTTYPDLRTL